MSQTRTAASATLQKKRTSRVLQSGREAHTKKGDTDSLSLSRSLAPPNTELRNSLSYGYTKTSYKGL
jgi:hypothetical protein